MLVQDLLSSLLCLDTEKHIPRCEDFGVYNWLPPAIPALGSSSQVLCRDLVSFVLLVPTKAGNKILVQFQSFLLQTVPEQRKFNLIFRSFIYE